MAFEQVDIGFAFINAQSNIVINYCKQWAILKIYARLFARRLLRSLMCNCYIFVSCLALTALLRFEKTSEKRWRKKKGKDDSDVNKLFMYATSRASTCIWRLGLVARENAMSDNYLSAYLFTHEPRNARFSLFIDHRC